MTDQPDKLFRDKLQHYHLPPPASAWAAIEKNLRQHRPFAYWKAAAAIALLALAGWLLYRINLKPETQHEKPLAQQTELVTPPPAVAPQPVVDRPAAAPGHPKHAKKEPYHQRKIVVTAAAPPDQLSIAATEEVTSHQPVLEERTLSTPTGNTWFIPAHEAQQFLKANVADATSEEKKSSRFQKFVELAGIIASEDDMMGRLRERKDNLLWRGIRSNHQQQN
jgi:hypothetical protein